MIAAARWPGEPGPALAARSVVLRGRLEYGAMGMALEARAALGP